VFEAMVREGDAVAYVGVLSACSRAGMLDDGLHCFDDGLLHQELTERAAGARRAAVPGSRMHPKTPKQREGERDLHSRTLPSRPPVEKVKASGESEGEREQLDPGLAGAEVLQDMASSR
jgi:pentatricopeptide repeat protein